MRGSHAQVAFQANTGYGTQRVSGCPKSKPRTAEPIRDEWQRTLHTQKHASCQSQFVEYEYRCAEYEYEYDLRMSRMRRDL